jgi:hypothetical protein
MALQPLERVFRVERLWRPAAVALASDDPIDRGRADVENPCGLGLGPAQNTNGVENACGSAV